MANHPSTGDARVGRGLVVGTVVDYELAVGRISYQVAASVSVRTTVPMLGPSLHAGMMTDVDAGAATTVPRP